MKIEWTPDSLISEKEKMLGKKRGGENGQGR